MSNPHAPGRLTGTVGILAPLELDPSTSYLGGGTQGGGAGFLPLGRRGVVAVDGSSLNGLVEAVGEAKMTSLEIARLTGRLHKSVLSDIRKVLAELGLSPADFSARYLDAKGEARECFHLPKRETFILVTGYSVGMRAAVVDRWSELEGRSRSITQSQPSAEQLLGPVMGSLSAITQTLQTLVQLQSGQFQQSPQVAQTIKEAKPRRTVVKETAEGLAGAAETDYEPVRTGYRGRKPTFTRNDIAAVLALTRKGKTARETASILGLHFRVVEHIRYDPSWADMVLKKWAL